MILMVYDPVGKIANDVFEIPEVYAVCICSTVIAGTRESLQGSEQNLIPLTPRPSLLTLVV